MSSGGAAVCLEVCRLTIYLGPSIAMGWPFRSGSTLPLSRVLLLALGSLILLAGGSVLLLLRVTSEHLLLDVGTRGFLRTMDLVEAVVRGHLDPVEIQVDTLGRLIASEEIQSSDLERLTDVFSGALASTPQIRLLMYCDADLQVVSGSQERDVAEIEIEDYQGKDDVPILELDAAMRVAEAAQWGEIVYSKHFDRTILNVAYPVRSDDRYLGFVAAAVTTREMSRMSNRIRESMGISTFLMLGDNNVVAHPDLATDNTSATTDELSRQIARRSPIGNITFSAETDLDEPDDPNDSNPYGAGQLEAFEFRLSNKKYIGVTRSLQDYGKPPISIGAYFRTKLVRAPMQLLYTAGGIGFIVLGAAIGLAALLTRAVTAPIRRVSHGVTQIGQFSLEDVEEMSRSRLREVDELADSFNRMLKALRSFATYVPDKLANLVMQGVVGASVESEERELTVMFTDIASFTAQCEGMNAIDVAAFVNEHLTLLAECVEATGGTIDKYIGDALMAFWGAPERMENTATPACQAALMMARKLREDNQRRADAGKNRVRLRIGIHTGPLVVGNIGAPGRINYTVVGDTVNTAQRLESLGKQVAPDAEIVALISAATASQIPPELATTCQGEFKLHGKEEPLTVYSLLID